MYTADALRELVGGVCYGGKYAKVNQTYIVSDGLFSFLCQPRSDSYKYAGNPNHIHGISNRNASVNTNNNFYARIDI